MEIVWYKAIHEGATSPSRVGTTMPFRIEYFPREILLTCDGVTVYHDYKNDGSAYQGTKLSYLFTVSPGEDAASFDVRDLPSWKLFMGRERMAEEQKISLTIKRSIMRKELPIGGT